MVLGGMKRILIIGCSGSGKSTFARALHQKTGIEVLHLDQYYWQPNWVESSKEEWRDTVSDLVQRESWIMEGNYSGTFDLRLPRADTIIFLDFSTLSCLWRVLKRTIRYHGTTRPDMTKNCPERFDLEFFHYILSYNSTRRKGILKILEQLKNEKTIHIFKNDKEKETFLRSIAL